ncbi:MAG: penicillin-binding protein 2 [Candidatus Margulisbacteria bacterium]|jgi:penicillin-binding protein 2|nr:penicillin-binding protein 2 [Candidatus Margulisiibacteriota bacterium]
MTKLPERFTAAAGWLVLSLLLGRLFFLQIVRHSYYDFLADGIRSRIVPSIAPRGVIYDRNGVALAESRLVYELDVLPYQLKDAQLVLRFLRGIGLDVSKLSRRLADKDYLPYELLTVSPELTPRQISYIEENKALLDGVIISARIVRYYPYANAAAHVLGYVGQIGQTELNKLKNYGYQMGDIVGLAGVERYYDQYLRGVNGGRALDVDALGNPVRGLRSLEPMPGADVHLTLDFGLQRQAARALGDRKGAIVILSPDNGEVLALVSKPDYNPNYFTSYMSAAEWRELVTKDHPMHNRALSGYPPGSIFKVVTLLAALESKIDPLKTFICQGFMTVNRRRFDCWRPAGHGRQDILNGFVNSCNIVFYNLGLLVSPQKLADTAAALGLGLATDIDLPFESSGFVPSERWKQRNYAEKWYPGDSLNMAIGQGYLLTTPLQMAVLTAALANEQHKIYRPYLLRKIVSVEGKNILQNRPEQVSVLPFERRNIALTRRLMREVVDRGTGLNARAPGLVIHGKTGTAENQQKDHAWFISFGPYEHPDLAIAVFVEEGGWGSAVAAGLAKELYVWYDARAKGRR